MRYQFHFFPYKRAFITPLKTHHGIWRSREGIIVTLTDPTGHQTQGEIAPLPWFGTETQAAAIALCESFGTAITTEEIYQIKATFPASQFGLETATWRTIPKHSFTHRDFCQLLQPNPHLFEQLSTLLAEGFRTFKLKIAVTNPEQEQNICEQILGILPDDGKLRLDANGGLTFGQAKSWCAWGDRQPKLEFIEQPLAPEYFRELLWLQEQYQTPLALDESVTNLQNLAQCYQQGWQGIFVIKGAIAGFPSHLQRLWEKYPLDLVFSTVFETDIGQQALLHLATLSGNKRALGMGGNHWFK